ncbi:MAG TPA: succinylglutamate desuccinylase/aspartoacylase family protein [Polyangiales bacterium]|nr:succinylglutamate desuccinylase/aspartoacylase family protein [Polyangiales bacterium]
MPSAGKPKTGSKVRPRPPFEVNGVTAPAGRLTEVELRIARLPTGMWFSLPVGVVHGKNPGPVIWISAAIHGDELNGVPIIRHVLDRIDPAKLSGTVLAVPAVNVLGLVQESRYLPDRRDLNRCFPGSKRGSSASQLAHLFMTEIVARSSVGIDLHTGSGGRTNLPQLRCDLEDPETLRLAREFAPPILVHARVRDGSLRGAAAELGKTVLLYEAGEASRFSASAIDMGVRGILRVMQALDMLDSSTEPAAPAPRISRSSSWLRAQRTGFCEMMVSLGAEVREGDTVAIIFGALGRKQMAVKAKSAGVVIGHVTSPIVHRGDAVANIATVTG